MAEIIPAIIGFQFSEVRDRLAQVEGLADWVQLDIMDGLFVPPYTWQNPEDLNEVGGKAKIEAHLMVEQPEIVLRDWMNVVDRVIVHYESTENLDEIVDAVTGSSVKLGIALKLETPIESLIKYADSLSHVQLMGIAEIGYHGKPFDIRTLERIETLRQKFPNATIAIDGGITLETGKEAIRAGADALVVGSALWESEDVAHAFQEFKAL
ncbi:MAG TPA: hypothetical protein VEB60_03085 [Candidatus Paceibacterota bacterium]|nr:hypothetical protein [Candidatus Paceibacterota bacterium]